MHDTQVSEGDIASYIRVYFDKDFNALDEAKKNAIMEIVNNKELTDPNRRNYQVGKILGFSNSQLNKLRDLNRRNPELDTKIMEELRQRGK